MCAALLKTWSLQDCFLNRHCRKLKLLMFFIIKLSQAEYFKDICMSLNKNYVKLLVPKLTINLRIKLKQNNKVRQYSREQLHREFKEKLQMKGFN
jgi:hypothetical protein